MFSLRRAGAVTLQVHSLAASIKNTASLFQLNFSVQWVFVFMLS
jgi:hypothetical protein